MFPLTCRHARRAARTPLLAAAALVIAVPGLLVSACSGQAAGGQGAGGRAGPEAATQGGPAAAPSGTTSAPAPRRSVRAARLLAQAAQAAVATTYQGEEIVSRWGIAGDTVLITDIWHIGGGPTVTETPPTGSDADGGPYLSADTDGQEPEGVLGVTAPLMRLLQAHYVLVYGGTDSADSRTAQVVEAWRADGSLAAKFWLDDATNLPLQRQVFDSAAHMISEDAFIDVRFGGRADLAMPRGAPQGPWTDPPLPVGRLLALHSRGWLVPSALPGGLSLFTGDQDHTSTGTVLYLGYSDGLSAVSVFEQHGNLAPRLAGWQKTTVAGHVVYAAQPDQRSLTWASHGIVYTVMADAPAQTVAAVVRALPHEAAPGFWKRISRGLARLVSVVNPFR